MKKYIFIFSIIFSIVSSCGVKKERIFLLSTEYGDIKFKLYNETPIHRDNFTKLVKTKFYDNLIFHRVIRDFMIQGGNPALIESGEKIVDPNIDAEIVANLFHQKGAVAAARFSDDVNPEKRSSAYQFYIVQGKVFTDEDLNTLEKRSNVILKQSIENKLKGTFENDKLKEEVKKQFLIEKYTISDERRQLYKTVGGTPHLDGNYTVFGQVIEGFNVIELIASVETNRNNRPVKDIKMTIKRIK